MEDCEMESIKHALGETLGSDVVRLLNAVERGDHDSIDGTQALTQFERLTRDLHPVPFLQVAREALGFLSRPQRLALAELLQARARYTDLTAPGLMKQGLQDPGEIALALQALHHEDPELVIELLGSEFRDLPVMKLTLAALAAVAAKHRVLPAEHLR
jgi:hypothetical protein